MAFVRVIIWIGIAALGALALGVVALTRGEVATPSTAIRARFGAEFVVTDLKHTAFLKRAAADAGLQEVYRDSQAAVFQVRP